MDIVSSVRKAYAAFQAGDLKSAAQWSAAVLKLRPEDTDALLVHAMVANAKGQFDAAARGFRTLTRLQPREPVHWMNLATAERAAGRLDAAAEGYARAAQVGGWSADLHYNTALLELERGDLAAARDHLGRAAAAGTVDAEIGTRYAQLLMQVGEPAALREHLRHWQQWQRWTAELLAQTAMLLLTVGDQASTQTIVEHLGRQAQLSLQVELTLVALLERTNRLDEALLRFARLPRPQPSSGADLVLRWLGLAAQLASRQGHTAESIRLYREMLATDIPLPTRHEVLFPLAKALDSDGQPVAALEAVAEAHASQTAFLLRAAPVAIAPSAEPTGLVDADCDPDDVAHWRDDDAPSAACSPVFIVAFPRSGTTLLEQMLDAHPDLRTMDEQRFLLDAQECLQALGVDYPTRLAAATPEQLAQAREVYWAHVAQTVKLAPGQRLLDKNPLNMLRLPVIRRLWPNAPVLLAIRHPFDVITSNYFQHYRAPDFARLCRDLPTLAAGYAQIFDHWYRQEAVLKPRVLEVVYEDFVADFAANARRIADFCGLSWHDAMLDPAQHARSRGYIGTPSYHQVVQPVNARSVGRWRRYEQQLAPLKPTLAHLLRRWGYPD